MISTAAAMEKAGIPAVGTVSTFMTDYTEIMKIANRMPDLRTYLTPMPTEDNAEDLAREFLPRLVEGLTTPLTEKEKAGGTIAREKRPRIAFTGTYEECLAFLAGDLTCCNTTHCNLGLPQAEYTDGSGVVLPTPELVEKMLTGTSHPPDEAIGIMQPGGLEFTVEKVAMNAVMAGGKPEYLPVVLALAKVLATEGARLSRGGPPNIWPVVSGPITKEIGMDSAGFQGSLNPANNSIGRAVTLMVLNLGGGASILHTPHLSAFAENIASPWTLLGEDAGFKRDQSVVCLIGGGNSDATWDSAHLYQEEGPEMYLKRLSRHIARMGQGGEWPTIVICPPIARDLATKLGMTKEDVKQWLYDHTFWTKEEYEWRAWRDRSMPPEIAALPDDALIRVIGSPYHYRAEIKGIEDRPDDICIVVAGSESPYPFSCKGNETPYGRWIEPVDVWR